MEIDKDILKGKKALKRGSLSVYADEEMKEHLAYLKSHNISIGRFIKKMVRLKAEELKAQEMKTQKEEEVAK